MESSQVKIFEVSSSFETWCLKFDHLIETEGTMVKKDVRRALIKLFKEYWLLQPKMQALVERVNALLDNGLALMSRVSNFSNQRLRRAKNEKE